jgi:hypothetical protein
VHRRDEHHALADAGVANGFGNVVGDADELAPALGVEGLIDGVRPHAQGIVWVQDAWERPG